MESRYEHVKQKALEDTQLYEEIGRLRLPSLTPSTDSVEDVSKLDGEHKEDIVEIYEHKGCPAQAIHKQVWAPQLSELYILLSSDGDDNYCRCKTSTQMCEAIETSAKGNLHSKDSIFDGGDVHKQALRRTNRTSLQYEHQDGEPVLTTATNSNLHLQLNIVDYVTKKESTALPNQQEPTELRMVSSRKQLDRPQPWSTNEKRTPSSRREERVSTKQASTKTKEPSKIVEMPIGSGRRKKCAPIQCKQSKGRKRGSTLTAAVQGVLQGKLLNVVPDAEELRRKREQDTIKCGRTLRTTSNVALGEPDPHVFEKDSTTDQRLQSPPVCGRVAPNTELHSDSEDAVGTHVEDCEGFRLSPSLQERLEDQDDTFLKKADATEKDSSSALHCNLADNACHEEADAVVVEPLRESFDNDNCNARNISAVVDVQNNQGRSRPQQNVSPRPRCLSIREQSDDSETDGDHGRRTSRKKGIVYRSRSPRRCRSRSPAYDDLGRERRRTRDYYRYHGKRDSRERSARKNMKDKRKHRLHRRRDYTSSSESGYKYRRSLSPDLSRAKIRTARSLSKSELPSTSLPQQSDDEEGGKEGALVVPNEEEPVVASESIDRRTKRYKQAIWEAETLKREREGKKAFYLTVDKQGRPYGPGRAAWIAHVNKLASWLDPSCTHIRKQTYEDMCILKDRLNDNFEYSADVSEDYLRGLLGKAVTRKRTELISLINRNGEQPKHLDKVVWERLENLARSRQREKKTEHGRYANSRRKTFGRTGSLGEDGVRERLRNVLGRSPDYEEVADEMQRDKGFGKKLEGQRAMSEELQTGRTDGPLQENSNHSMHVYLKKIQSDGSKKEGSEDGRRMALRSAAIQSDEEVPWMHVRNTESLRRESGMETQRERFVLTEKNSKDDYIACLEEELRTLRGDVEPSSSLRRPWRSEGGSLLTKYT